MVCFVERARGDSDKNQQRNRWDARGGEQKTVQKGGVGGGGGGGDVVCVCFFHWLSLDA